MRVFHRSSKHCVSTSLIKQYESTTESHAGENLKFKQLENSKVVVDANTSDYGDAS